MQERGTAGSQRFAFIEPDGQLLFLPQHRTQFEIGELPMKVADDRQTTELRRNLPDSGADPGRIHRRPQLESFIVRIALTATGDEGIFDVVERRLFPAA